MAQSTAETAGGTGGNGRLFHTDGLTKHFGGVHAVEGLDIEVQRGQIVGLIGPNGAGKTTVFNCIQGFERCTRGAMYFNGVNINQLRPDQVCAMGIGRTFQNIRMFRNMTVLDNVLVGAHHTLKSGIFGAIFGGRGVRREEAAVTARALEIMEMVDPTLVTRAQAPGGDLPYADQRRLEIARVLATEPQLLLLDEPTAGMNLSETEAMVADIARLSEMGYTIILVEHKMQVIMGICNPIIVLNYGEKIAEGTPAQISSNEQVIEAYLGRRKSWKTE